MIVLDANVLGFAVGSDHPLREPARRVLTAVRDDVLTARTTVGAIQEFMHFHARHNDRGRAVEHARDFCELLDPIPDDAQTLTRATTLFDEHPDLDSADCLLLAAARMVGASAILTADDGFRTQRQVAVIGLKDRAALARLLRPDRQGT